METPSLAVRCTCKSQFQDETYGVGIRVATPVNKTRDAKSNRLAAARCTVCGKEHTTVIRKSKE